MLFRSPRSCLSHIKCQKGVIMSKIVDLATELADLKNQKDSLSDQEKAINIRIEKITRVLLPEAMDEDGISNISIDGVGRVTLRGEVYTSISAVNREAAYEWLRDTGRGSLISETVNASTLKAAVKEWLKQGEDIPDIINVTPVTVAVLTKSK